MDNVNWEYKAPKFIDFEANEHLCKNNDEFFDITHESEELDFNVDNEQATTVEKNIKTPDHQVKDSLFQTPSRETYGVKTPSRVLRSCLQKETGPSNLIDVGNLNKSECEILPTAIDHTKDNICLSSETPSKKKCVMITPSRVLRSSSKLKTQSNSVKVLEEIDKDLNKENKSGVLSNVITPSRYASWKNNKVAFSTGKTFGSDSKKKPSYRKKINQLAKTEPTCDPPKKKLKKETPNRKTTVLNENILQSHKSHKRHLTSEKDQLQNIKKLCTTGNNIKEDKKQLKKLQHSTPSCSSKQVTQTKEFHFKTDERASKTHNMSTRSDVFEKNNFQDVLRKYAPSPIKKSRTTVVKPFNLTKRKRSDDIPKTGNFVPMAKAILDFQSRTPTRFRKNNSQLEAKPCKPLRATIPKTPNISKTKSRPVSVMSAQEKENLEVEEMKKHQFKAKPLSSSLLSAPEHIKKVEKKPVTIPVEFHLSSNSHKNIEKPEVEKPKPFAAQPIPNFVFEKPAGKKKRPTEVTVPMSPAFALKSRLRPKKSEVDANSESQPQKFYHPPPNPSHAFKPKKLHSTSTIPQPFSFHVRDMQKLAKKQEKTKEILEKESACSTFKAQPMPLPPSPGTLLPPKQTKEPTKAEPFKLKTDERAALRVEEWEKQLECDLKAMREKASFKANQNYEKIVKGKPWEPKLEHKPPTEPMKVVLRSELRAKEREEFDKRLHDEMMEKERVLEEERLRQEAASRQEVEELRKNQVHKAQEIHKFKGVKVVKSSKQLTMPESPKFSTRFNK